MQFRKIAISTFAAATLVSSCFSEISPIFSSSGLAVTLKNETNLPWMLGGIRFKNEGFAWSGLDNGYMKCKIINTPIEDGNLVDLFILDNAPNAERKLSLSQTKPFTHRWANNPSGSQIDTSFIPEILLKTGGAGTIDPISTITAPAITVDELRALASSSDFYNRDYRYTFVDSLGVNGGTYSGGFTDTWVHDDIAETQMQIAYPIDTFTLNNFGINLDTSVTKGPMYWMTLAMGQEYFSVDLQWMMAMGIKEGNAGVAKQHFTNDVHYDGGLNHTAGYGAWHTEGATALDRALAYPHFFPKYAQNLSISRDIQHFLTSSNISDVFEPLDYYCGDTTEINSAQILNTMIISILTQYANYDVFASSTDICWKEALESAVDPYMGLGAMIVVYNQGNSNVKKIAGDLNSTSYEATCQNPNAHLIWGTGLNNYIPSMLVGIQNFIDASRLSQTDANVEILDHPISQRELLNLFFGDDGTVETQGPGGLLRHYYDPATGDYSEIRTEIWNRLTEGFSILKGRAPFTDGSENISLRYDFLSLIRTVKEYFPFDRRVPLGGDAVNIIIPSNSGNYPSCNETASTDTLYPTSIIVDTLLKEQISLQIKAKDNGTIKDLRWSVDPNWNVWHKATYVSGSGGEQLFKVSLPVEKFDVKDGPVTLWYMVRDENYNSTVRKVVLNEKVAISPTKNSQLTSLSATTQKGSLTVRSMTEQAAVTIELFSPQGRLLKTLLSNQTLPGMGKTFQTKELRSGTCILRVSSDSEVFSQKITLY